MWAAARWCSATWGRRSGRSCWRRCSRARSPPAGSDKAAAAGRAAGAAAGRRRAAPDRRRSDVVAGPSSPCRRRQRQEGQGLKKRKRAWSRSHDGLRVCYLLGLEPLREQSASADAHSQLWTHKSISQSVCVLISVQFHTFHSLFSHLLLDKSTRTSQISCVFMV